MSTYRDATAPSGLGGSAQREVSGLTIVIIDDDADVRRTMQLLLTRLGNRVTTIETGEEALLRFEDGLDADLILLDLNMPGLGGGGTLEGIRALRPDIPVIISTGFADRQALELTEIHWGVVLLQKPFTLSELREKLASAVAMRA